MTELKPELDLEPGYWTDGELPRNVELGSNSVIIAPHCFKRFRSRNVPGLKIGDHCTRWCSFLDRPERARDRG
jgi:hypothetical protein